VDIPVIHLINECQVCMIPGIFCDLKLLFKWMLDILKFVWLRLGLFDNSGVENEQLKVERNNLNCQNEYFVKSIVG
jgi:hypothetical protein